jgi:hypothetical protein
MSHTVDALSGIVVVSTAGLARFMPILAQKMAERFFLGWG